MARWAHEGENMRDIDKHIRAVEEDERIPLVDRLVLVRRLNQEPTREERNEARKMAVVKCDECGATYTSAVNLRAHIQKQHPPKTLAEHTTKELLEELQQRGDLEATVKASTDGAHLSAVTSFVLRSLDQGFLEAVRGGS